jgi:hypothetical protein
MRSAPQQQRGLYEDPGACREALAHVLWVVEGLLKGSVLADEILPLPPEMPAVSC